MQHVWAVAAAAAVLTCWAAHFADAGTIPEVQVRHSVAKRAVAS
jgi:hypothetical protein